MYHKNLKNQIVIWETEQILANSLPSTGSTKTISSSPVQLHRNINSIQIPIFSFGLDRGVVICKARKEMDGAWLDSACWKGMQKGSDGYPLIEGDNYHIGSEEGKYTFRATNIEFFEFDILIKKRFVNEIILNFFILNEISTRLNVII